MDNSMKHLIVSLVIGLALVPAGCERDKYVEKSKEEIAARSANWKAKRRAEDFLWLAEHAIPTGSSDSHVKELLGEPLPDRSRSTQYCYVNSYGAKDSVYTLGVEMDQSSGVEYFRIHSYVRWRTLEPDAGEYQLVPDLIEELHGEFLKHFPVPTDPAKAKDMKAYLRRIRPRTVRKLPYETVRKQRKKYPGAKLTKYGNVSGLQQDGECWLLFYTDFTGVIYMAFLDLHTRKLVLLERHFPNQ